MAPHSYDAVIVGARCAGATLAIRLARAGRRVLMIDQDPLGSDTLSTHLMFPNTVARLDELGVLGELHDRHRLRPVMWRMRILGREVTGAFTPVAGYDRCVCVRRPLLDRALAEAALAAGAHARFGERVAGLLGAGTGDDPVRGVILENAERIEAEWVFAADGRASRLARKLAPERTRPICGEISYLLSYWRGLPRTECAHLEMNSSAGITWFPCEDGVDLLASIGGAQHTRGGRDARERAHLARLHEFPETLDPLSLERAERISEVRAAPESMLRGFFRRASGPGWALVGDAGHFKHPASAQGISDAIEQAIWVADAVTRDDAALSGYAEWRDRRADGHYEWSFVCGRFAQEAVHGVMFDRLLSDSEAAQLLRDVLTRRVRPDALFAALARKPDPIPVRG